MNSSYTVEAVMKATGASKFQQAFANAEQSMKKFEKVGKSLTKKVTLPIVGMGAAIAVTGAKFDDQMQTVQAVTRASGKEMESMRDLAKDMGKSTRFSASEAAEGMEMLARAGFETDEIMTAIPEVLTLAAAGAVDLGSAADITSNILSGFKLEADETGRVVDILAQASADSNVDVESLGEAMKYVAPVASDLGISIEDTTAAIGLLGDAGIQGGQAGRQLRKGIQSLAAPTDQAASLMNELGIEVFDANGKMKDLPSIIGELETGLDGMGDAQRTAALETFFGSDAMSAWSILVGEGSDELGIFSNELANSKGAAKEMSDTMEDSVAGAFREMKSAIEGLAIEFYEMGEGPLKSLIEGITKLVNKFTESSDKTKQWIIVIAGIAAAIGPVLLAIKGLIAAVVAVTKAFAVVKVAVAAGGAAIAALSAPVLIAVGVITGLIAIGVALYKNWDTVKARAGQLRDSISSAFNRIKESISNAANSISNAINRIKSFFTSLGSSGSSMSTSVSGAWGRMVSAVSSAVGRISGFVGNVRSSFNSLRNISLVSAGRSIMSGFTRGLKSAWGSGKKFIRGIGGWIAKNKGPISYDRRLLKPAGNAIIGGLNKGLQDSFPDVQKTVKGIAGAINETMTGGPVVDISGSVAKSNAGVSRVITHELNNNMSTQPAYINVNIGGQNFRGFVENISNEQGKITDLELQF